jgi:hypothetical protein
VAEGSGRSEGRTPEPVAAVPSTPEPVAAVPSALQSWEGVCDALEEAKEFGLMTVYQTAKVLRFDETRVELGFPADGMTSEIAVDKEKIARMGKFVRTHTGIDLKFEVRLLNADQEADALSVVEDQKQRNADELVRRREEAQEHPMTKKVLRTFGAAIKEIKVENV